MDKDYVIQILDGCGFHATIGLRVLINRCLVMIGKSNEILMHDLLRDMGREIICEESVDEPGERSRLWHHEDVINMLTNKMGTRAIKGITLKLPEERGMSIHKKEFPKTLNLPVVNGCMSVDTKEFSKLQKLRLLHLDLVQLSGGYENFSKELRWLCWHGCPLKFIPNDFDLGNLVALDMERSNLREVWKGSKVLEKLKLLDLSHSHYLTRTPDFSNVPNLEELKLEECIRLVEVHHSIGNLERLALIDLRNCEELRSLPWNFCKLKSLQTLTLSGCSKLDMLPQDLGSLKSLATLVENNSTGTRRGVQGLVNLPQFSLCCCIGSLSNSLIARLWSWILPRSRPPINAINLLTSSLRGLRCLKKLHLGNCNLTDDVIPKDFWGLSSLEALNLGGNNILSLPTGIRDLSKLHLLILDNCKRLQAIEDLPASLNALETGNCNSLERLPDLTKCKYLNAMSLGNCSKLIEAGRLDILRKPALVPCLRREREVYTSEGGGLIQEWFLECYGGIYLPGNEIPDWFEYKEEGSSIVLDVPVFADYELLTLDVCCVVSRYVDATGVVLAGPVIKLCNHSKGYIMRIVVVSDVEIRRQEDHLWRAELHTVDVDVSSEDKVEIGLRFSDQTTAKKIGVHLHFKIRNEGSNEGDDEDQVTKDEMEVKADQDSNNSDDEEAIIGEARIKAKRGLDEDDEEPSSDVERPGKRLKCDNSVKENVM